MLMVASTETLRRQNRALVLSCLRERGALAHTDIAEWTGLSSATVSVITQELLSEEILVKAPQAASTGRGRPRVLLQKNPDAAFISVIRITSEEIECSLVDYSATLKDRFTVGRVIEGQDPEQFGAQLRGCVERQLSRSELNREQLKIISITSKGLVTPGRPILNWSPVYGNQQLDFEKLLSPNWNVSVRLSNETQFVAEGIALRRLHARGNHEAAMHAVLSLDHSIGLGISKATADGRVTAEAPDFGHMTHAGDGPLCRCGNRGCIESYAGFYGILREAFDVPSDTIPAKFVPLEQVDRIANDARRGDLKAQYAFRHAGEILGIGISRLMSMFGRMPVTVTGRGLKYFDLMRDGFVEPLRGNLQVRLTQMPEIELEMDQTTLIYEGNVSSSLARLDLDILSEGVS